MSGREDKKPAAESWPPQPAPEAEPADPFHPSDELIALTRSDERERRLMVFLAWATAAATLFTAVIVALAIFGAVDVRMVRVAWLVILVPGLPLGRIIQRREVRGL